MEQGTANVSLGRLRPGYGRLRAALAYVELSKPASVALLVFVGLCAYIVGADGAPAAGPLLVLLLAGAAGSAGANAVTCYVDRDIDAVMGRTARRPLPSGRIVPQGRALAFGLALMAIALLLSVALGPLAVALMAVGLADNVVVYSLLSKRRSPWSVLVGGVSGGVPAAYGWVAATGALAPTPVLMAALVVLWIPVHIWSLAMRYRDDYGKVGVPMLPVVSDTVTVARWLAGISLLLVASAVALGPVGGLGPLYLAAALLSGLAIAAAAVRLAVRPSAAASWLLFKLSSPYLAVVFGAMVVEVLVR